MSAEQNLISPPEKPQIDTSFRCVVVADGLPIVEASKVSKFQAFITKKFAQFKVDVDQPVDEQGNGVGFAFLTFETPEVAAQAITAMNGKPIDKTSKFILDFFDSFDNVDKIPDTAPQYDDNALIKDQFIPYMNDHLIDPNGRDQLLFRWQDKDNLQRLQVDWFDPLSDDILTPECTDEDKVKTGKDGKKTAWTNLAAGWSSKGNYLYTFHQKGLALWAGDGLARIRSINHADVAKVQFSPCERWVVTLSYQQKPSILCDVIVSSVLTGEIIVRYNTLHRDQPWPFFKWSSDGNYFARVSNVKQESNGKVSFIPKGIAIYDMTKRELFGGKPFPAPGLCDFSFSPVNPGYIAYCAIGQNNMPSVVAVHDITTNKQILKAPAFGVETWKISWEGNGSKLLTYMDRRVDKRNMQHILSVYDMNAKRPAAVTLNLTKPALNVSLSSKTNKILISSLIAEDRQRYKAEFSVLSYNKKEITNIWSTSLHCSSDVVKNIDASDPEHTITAHFNQKFSAAWSPTGNVFYISTSGVTTTVELYSVDGNSVSSFGRQIELAHANKLEWDPTGRYFILANVQPYDVPSQIESRFQIIDFQGNVIIENVKPRLLCLDWRPMSLDHLTKEQIQEVHDQLMTKYWTKYNAKGDQAKSRLRRLRINLRDLIKHTQEVYESTKADRIEAYGGWCTEDDEAEDNYIEVSPEDYQ